MLGGAYQIQSRPAITIRGRQSNNRWFRAQSSPAGKLFEIQIFLERDEGHNRLQRRPQTAPRSKVILVPKFLEQTDR
jgi:hypothetical protein